MYVCMYVRTYVRMYVCKKQVQIPHEAVYVSLLRANALGKGMNPFVVPKPTPSKILGYTWLCWLHYRNRLWRRKNSVLKPAVF